MSPKNHLNIKTDTARIHNTVRNGITILYEDRAAGFRAQHFGDQLDARIREDGNCRISCWRLELIELAALAEEIQRDAASSEFVIVALRGCSSLSMTIKRRVESWLKDAAGVGGLVVLFDPRHCMSPHTESTRLYLRHAADKAGAAFYAHYTMSGSKGIGIPFYEVQEPVSERLRRNMSTLALFTPREVAA